MRGKTRYHVVRNAKQPATEGGTQSFFHAPTSRPATMPGIRNVRKRPAIAVSDDDEQSDASYGSGMSKRARHDRDAPDNPAPTNGYRQRPDDDDDDRIYEEGVYQPGSIVRVKLTNFVTYTAVEFHLGPSLNMIIGPNGTGKSTLVCAICLGLGWSPQVSSNMRSNLRVGLTLEASRSSQRHRRVRKTRPLRSRDRDRARCPQKYRTKPRDSSSHQERRQ